MAQYIKLGSNASSFNDPFSGLSLANHMVAIFTPKMQSSKLVKQAISGGHLAVATEEEYKIFIGDKPPKIETIDSEFGKTAEELISYYTKTYDVSDKHLKAFKKKDLEEMVKELQRLKDDE